MPTDRTRRMHDRPADRSLPAGTTPAGADATSPHRATLLRNSTALRLFVLAAMLLGIEAGFQVLRARRSMAEVEMPPWKLDQMPRELGDWHGEPTEVDSRIFRNLGAAQTRDTLFYPSFGPPVVAHVAIFDQESSGLPHHPDLCYGGNGYRQVAERPIRIRTDSGREVPATLVTYERENDRLAVLFWYQYGDRILTESSQMAAARLAVGARRARPAMVKVMLQTPLDAPEQAEGRLRDLARLILAWMDNPTPAKAKDSKT